MQDAAIVVEDVSKVFRIYDHPTDRLKEAFSLKRKKYHTDFSALRNINFEVKKGEFLGIVGRNGAGKSTLLRMLSRELTPTTGKVQIDGKVSLLQLGVGFDLDLTGIENAKFASKLLGYSDDEVNAMMEEIIAFADIGEFIHHPVKTYSSGMYSRLSFAVGININPDILIADEVLSVGDMRFSQKCLRKMREFKDQGKTIIFVSHDTQSVNVFCDTAMWLMNGEIFMRGDAKRVTIGYQNYMLYDKLPNEYHGMEVSQTAPDQNISLISESREAKLQVNDLEPVQTLSSPHLLGQSLKLERAETKVADAEWINLSGVPSVGDGRAEIKRMAFVLADSLSSVTTVAGYEEVVLLLDIVALEVIEKPQVGFVIYNQQGLPALHTNNDICGNSLALLNKGQEFVAEFRFTLPSLANGHFMFSIALQSGSEMPHKLDDVYQFGVARAGSKGTQCGYVIIEKECFRFLTKNS